MTPLSLYPPRSSLAAADAQHRHVAVEAPLPAEGAVEARARCAHVPGPIAGPPHRHVGLAVAVEIAVLDRDVARQTPLTGDRAVEAGGRSPDIPGAVARPPDGHVGLAVAVEIAVLDGNVPL